MKIQVCILSGKVIKRSVITFLIIFSAISFAQDIVQMVKIGQKKNEIEKVLGTPTEIKHTVKTTENIWGPEEELWSDIPMKTKLEVWHYKNEHGQLNLYFVNGSNKLSFKAYAPVGVIYESN